MTSPNRRQVIDFCVLALRWYLAYYMFTYGWSKIFEGQFYVKPEILNSPVNEVDRFYLAWYVFGLSRTFNVVIGSLQIVGALLIVFNRTAVIGALFLLPVLLQILLTDIAFTMSMFGYALVIRLSMMLLSACVILWYYKARLFAAWNSLTGGIRLTLSYPWWVYLLLPFIGFATDFVFGGFTIPLKILLDRFCD